MICPWSFGSHTDTVTTRIWSVVRYGHTFITVLAVTIEIMTAAKNSYMALYRFTALMI